MAMFEKKIYWIRKRKKLLCQFLAFNILYTIVCTIKLSAISLQLIINVGKNIILSMALMWWVKLCLIIHASGKKNELYKIETVIVCVYLQ